MSTHSLKWSRTACTKSRDSELLTKSKVPAIELKPKESQVNVNYLRLFVIGDKFLETTIRSDPYHKFSY
jgi:hypothetical protein